MELSLILMTFGGLFVAGLVVDEIGRRTRMPRVTLLMILGVLSGPMGFDLLPDAVRQLYEPLTSIALTMVAFLLGGSLSLDEMRTQGRRILIISLAVVLATVVVVGAGLMALGFSLTLALVLAGIATATDPAATDDVIRQAQSKGNFARTLKGIVAIDDAWGLIVFSLLLVLADTALGNGSFSAMRHGLWELGGGAIVGIAIGVPSAYLTGRLKPGKPMQTEALAVVFLCVGLSLWAGASFLLAGIVAGCVVINFARHHESAFHEIEQIEWPFMILFFFLAGASLEPQDWQSFIAIMSAFVLLRVIGRVLGGWLGGKLSLSTAIYRRWMGLSLLPQAGVAVGMALVAANRFPDLREIILTTTIAATIVFETLGPILTRISLEKVKGNDKE